MCNNVLNIVLYESHKQLQLYNTNFNNTISDVIPVKYCLLTITIKLKFWSILLGTCQLDMLINRI